MLRINNQQDLRGVELETTTNSLQDKTGRRFKQCIIIWEQFYWYSGSDVSLRLVPWLSWAPDLSGSLGAVRLPDVSSLSSLSVLAWVHIIKFPIWHGHSAEYLQPPRYWRYFYAKRTVPGQIKTSRCGSAAPWPRQLLIYWSASNEVIILEIYRGEQLTNQSSDN